MNDTQRPDYLKRINAGLGPERAVVFMEMIAQLDIRPDSEQLVMAAAIASFMVNLSEFRTWGADMYVGLEKAFARVEGGVTGRIEEAFVRSADEFQTDIRMMARELATSEYRAAASLRSEAIRGEVQALTVAAKELAREREALDVRKIAAGSAHGAAVAVHDASLGPRFLGVSWSPAVFAAVAGAFVLGFAICLVMFHGGPHRL